MLPNMNHSPTFSSEKSRIATVARSVPVYFLTPIPSIVPGHFVTTWAPMPKAAVDEYSNMARAKNKVGLTWQVGVPPPALDAMQT